MSAPIVSIGLPVRNGEEFLRRAISSVLDQDFANLEVVIADNASDDATQEICRSFASADSRVRYHRSETNIGLVGNHSKVFRLSRGKYFRWQAYDDECYPGLIRHCVEALEAAPDTVAMVYPLGELIDENGIILESPLDRIECRDPRPHRRVAHLLRTINMVDPMFGLIRSEYLRRTQLIGPFLGGDYVMLAELAMIGEIWEVDEVLFRLRAHHLRTMKVYKSSRERAVLYDPSAATKLFVLPSRERLVLELVKAAVRSRLPLGEKLKCAAVMPTTHYVRRARNAGGRWKRRLRAWSGQALVGMRNTTTKPR